MLLPLLQNLSMFGGSLSVTPDAAVAFGAVTNPVVTASSVDVGTNQGKQQFSVRQVTGTELSYNGDWHALFDQAGIAEGTWDERMLLWLNSKLVTQYDFLPDAMNAFAKDQGSDSWNELGTFDAS